MNSRISKKSVAATKKQSLSVYLEKRPIRDVCFQNDAKLKVISFLDDSNYRDESNNNIFRNMSSADLKNIFEHFLCQICPGFKLIETNNDWEKVIQNFFTILKYKSNFTSAHMKSPTLVSSLTFVVAAFDFMRRVIQAYKNVCHHIMFPPLANIGISSEFIVKSLVEIKKKVSNEDIDDIENLLKEMKINLQNQEGIMTEEERSENDKRLFNIEKAYNDFIDAQLRIKECQKCNARLEEENEKFIDILRDMKITNKNLLMDITSQKNKNTMLIEEERRFKLEVDLFNKMGYDSTLTELNDQKEVLARLQRNCSEWKLKEEGLKKEVKIIETGIESMKLHTQTELIGVAGLANKEFNEIISHINAVDLLKYHTIMRPIFHALVVEIEKIFNDRVIEVDAKTIVSEAHDAEYLALKKKTEKMKVRETKLKMLLEKNMFNAEKFSNKAEEEQNESDELYQRLEEEKVETALQIKENIELKATMLREQQETNEAKRFFEADIDLRKYVAEVRVRNYITDYTLHKSIIEQRKKRLKREHDYLEELKVKTERLEQEVKENVVNEIKKLRRNCPV